MVLALKKNKTDANTSQCFAMITFDEVVQSQGAKFEEKNDADRILNKTALLSRIVIVFCILILPTLISVPAMVHSQP